MGVEPSAIKQGLMQGLLVGLPLSAVIVGGSLLGTTRPLYRAEHIVSASLPRVVYEAFVRIPLGTALPEEFLFRGGLLGALERRHTPEFSVAVSSMLFGLWHVAPAVRQSGPRGYGLSSRSQRILHVIASVAATAVAGGLLAAMRRRSGSIAAPWVVHAAVNGAGYLAAWAHGSR
jgi:membrane protease YdiL (CAAX protease family)